MLAEVIGFDVNIVQIMSFISFMSRRRLQLVVHRLYKHARAPSTVVLKEKAAAGSVG